MHSNVTRMLKGLNTNKAWTKVTILGCRETSEVTLYRIILMWVKIKYSQWIFRRIFMIQKVLSFLNTCILCLPEKFPS